VQRRLKKQRLGGLPNKYHFYKIIGLAHHFAYTDRDMKFSPQQLSLSIVSIAVKVPVPAAGQVWAAAI